MENISFSPPDITDAEINEVIDAMRSGWITTGTRTKQFESDIAQYIGTPKAACLNSATAAMEMTLKILGVGPGDEVILPAYTYTATASVVNHVGAKIVMIDSCPDSVEIDYSLIADAINERTKVIIPVDIAGRICDYDKVFEAVERKKSIFVPNSEYQKLFNRVIVMADASHSFGSLRNDKRSGNFADFSCFSFHAVKNLTTGEGGAVTWRKYEGLDDEELYRQFMLYSLHGQTKDALNKNKLGAWEYDIIYPAYKCNMTDIQAAFGLIQLQRYEGLLARRRQIVSKYDAALIPEGIISMPHFGDNYTSNCHVYLSRIPNATEQQRNDIITEMANAGIACNVHFKPLPLMTAYKNLGFDIKDFPNAYEQYKNEISLPLHTLLKDEDVMHIIEQYVKAVRLICHK